MTRCVSSSLSVAAFETAKGLFFFSQRPEEEEEERERKEEEGGKLFCLSCERGVVLVIKLLAFVVLLPRRAKRKCVCVDQTFRFFFFVTLLFFSTRINPLSFDRIRFVF